MTGRDTRAIEVAFLGCGQATREHSRTLARLDGSVRRSYASRDGERASEFREALGGARAFDSYDAALADPDVDVALVATPPRFHLDLTLRALSAGKDVIVEKPAFLEVEDFDRVRRALDRSAGRVFVAENYFYKPLRERLAEIVSSGGIGDPLLLQVDAVKRQVPAGWRARHGPSGGGALFEGGIHWINFLASLGLRAERVSGHRAGTGVPSAGGTGPGRAGDGEVPEASEDGTEESLLVVMEYAEGAVASLSYSWEVPSPLRGLRLSHLYGRRGAVTFESNGLFVFLRGTRTRFWIPGPTDIGGYRAMFRDFLDAIRSGREPRMTLEMAERDVRLVREAYASMSPRPGPTAGAGNAREEDRS